MLPISQTKYYCINGVYPAVGTKPFAGDADATGSLQAITGYAGASPAVGLAQNHMNLQCLWRRRVSRRHAPQAH